jgi:hypothetical protein
MLYYTSLISLYMEVFMSLWFRWMSVVRQLEAACSRKTSFLWLSVCLAGMCIRDDLMGVTSVVRTFGLKEHCYDRILDFFHSPAVNVQRLSNLWVKAVLRIFPDILTVNGRLLIVGDGIKIPKSGKKMPGVKLLHQESESNTKPQYIMGHSCQAVALLVGALKSVFAVPLASRIHEGVIFSNRDTRTLLDKMLSLADSLCLDPFYFIADAYYASRKMIASLLKQNNHLVSQVRSNAVAYLPCVVSHGKRKKGRPRIYGPKIKLKTLFDNPQNMHTAESPVYGEKGVCLRYRSEDLLLRRLGILVRFVAVVHPIRGSAIYLCTDLSLSPVEIIRLYGLRFKIEVSFKQAVRTIGAYAYHFWMKSRIPLRKRAGDQFRHRHSEKYRQSVRRKIDAYHRFIQIGLISQGLLQYLSVCFPDIVWTKFNSYIRTIRPGIPPSEYVTSIALKNCFPDFLSGSHNTGIFTKFLFDKLDLLKSKMLRLAA